MSEQFDLIIIGAGSGGVRAARIAATHGAKVAIIEASKLGGTCVNLGCVPKKLFAYASHFAEDFQNAKGYGWTTSSQFDWQALVINKNQEIERLNGIYLNMLNKAGVKLFKGVGRYLNANNAQHQISIEDHAGEKQVIRAKRVLIATGGKPSSLPMPGAEHMVVSDDLFFLPKLPQKMVIIGAGYIAVEFASIFLGLGVEVHLVVRGQQLLKAFDPQLGHWLEAAFVERGLHVHKGTTVTAIEQSQDGSVAHLQTANQLNPMPVDLVLGAVGRDPLVPDGLEAVLTEGLAVGGFIQVNDQFETSLPGLYAIGDVTGGAALTPVAIKQGHWLADHWYSHLQRPVLNIASIPTAVFTAPAMASVGFGEHELVAAGSQFTVFKSEFRPLKHTLANNPLKVGIKLLVGDDDKVLGMHMFGDEAPEIIQGLAVAFDMGVTKAQLDQTLGIHPTVGEEWVTLK